MTEHDDEFGLKHYKASEATEAVIKLLCDAFPNFEDTYRDVFDDNSRRNWEDLIYDTIMGRI